MFRARLGPLLSRLEGEIAAVRIAFFSWLLTQWISLPTF